MSLPVGFGLRERVDAGLHGILWATYSTQLSLFTICRMPYDFWKQDSQLFKQIGVDSTQRTADVSNSQLQQSLRSNSYNDTLSVDTWYQVTNGEDPTININNHLQALSHNFGGARLSLGGELESSAAGLQLSRNARSHYDTGSLQAWLPCDPLQFQHDMGHQFQEPHSGHSVNDHRVAESHAISGRVFICEWHDGSRLCGEIVYASRMAEHMTSYHLESALPGSHLLQCRWGDCQRKKHLRRDTIVRHIVEKHFKIKYRSKAWLARVISH
ncbi:hypothetical protein M405DRAFT_938978 [Rhizopogon salebrosus TDB-379]|nr:hypothetical protein M405DRAFT_938978 [Rhizopogon salebrosus TDB-379]